MANASLRDSPQIETDQQLEEVRQPRSAGPENGFAAPVGASRPSIPEKVSELAGIETLRQDELAMEHEPSGNEQPDDDETRLLAYFLWEERGGTHGSPDGDWFKARMELQERTMRRRMIG